MLLILKLLGGLVILFFIGYNLTYLVLGEKSESNWWEKIALSYGIGAGLLSLEMFLISSVGIPLTFGYIIIPWIPFLCFSIWKSNGRVLMGVHPLNLKGISQPRSTPGNNRERVFSVLEKIVWAVIFFEVFSVFFAALIKPIFHWDPFVSWSFKAKIFFMDEAIRLDFFHDTTKDFTFPDYPLLVPLTETWLFTSLGEWNDALVKVIFPLYYVCLLIIFYSALRRSISRMGSVLFTLFLATMPRVLYYSSAGYAEIPLAYYYSVSVISLFLWINHGNKEYLPIAAIFAGFAGWTKYEGQILLLVVFFLLVVFLLFHFRARLREKIHCLLIFLGIVILILSPWMIFKQLIGLHSEVVTSSTLNLSWITTHLGRLRPLGYAFLKTMLDTDKWNILWFALILATIFFWKRTFSSPTVYIFLSVVLPMALYAVGYLIVAWDIKWERSIPRYMVHFTPLSLFLLANQISFWNKIKRSF